LNVFLLPFIYWHDGVVPRYCKVFNMVTFCAVLWRISPPLVGILIVWAASASWLYEDGSPLPCSARA
jgi:hypothetical protein